MTTIASSRLGSPLSLIKSIQNKKNKCVQPSTFIFSPFGPDFLCSGCSMESFASRSSSWFGSGSTAWVWRVHLLLGGKGQQAVQASRAHFWFFQLGLLLEQYPRVLPCYNRWQLGRYALFSLHQHCAEFWYSWWAAHSFGHYCRSSFSHTASHCSPPQLWLSDHRRERVMCLSLGFDLLLTCLLLCQTFVALMVRSLNKRKQACWFSVEELSNITSATRTWCEMVLITVSISTQHKVSLITSHEIISHDPSFLLFLIVVCFGQNSMAAMLVLDLMKLWVGARFEMMPTLSKCASGVPFLLFSAC